MTDTPSDAFTAESARRLSPSAARRRLGHELRSLRESVHLTLAQAGRHMQRSSATMSRLESGRSQPRMVEIAALIDFYASINARVVGPEVRERVLGLAAESRRNQWFEPFRDVLTGTMTPDHIRNYVEYETDADEIRTFEPELIPGLLQTTAYAQAVTDIFYPGHDAAARRRFVEFRVARQRVLNGGNDQVRFACMIGESAIRRAFGEPGVQREQLQSLLGDLNGARTNVSIGIVPMSAAIPAAFGGPFVVMTFNHPEDNDLVYLETRSGGDYLEDRSAVERFLLYFDGLREVALPAEAAITLVNDVIGIL